MGKKQPESGKAKKAHLQAIRALKSSPSFSSPTAVDSSSGPASSSAITAGRHASTSRASSALEDLKRAEARRSARSALESRFIRLNKAQVEHYRTVVAKRPFVRPIPAQAAVLEKQQDQAEEGLTCPRRPKWKYYMLKKEVEKNESVMFEKWLKETEATLAKAEEGRPDRTMGYFERNLDVWRQLWRVCEVSSLLLVLLDARCPLLHFPPALQTYLSTLHPRKGVILVLTKTDLVPHSLVEEWEIYLEGEFGYRVVRAESYRLRETRAAAQGREKRRFDPGAPRTVRDGLVDALRKAHTELMKPPERIKPERRHLWRPHQSLRRDIDWDVLKKEPEIIRPSSSNKGKEMAVEDQGRMSKADAKKARKAERQEALLSGSSRPASRSSSTHRMSQAERSEGDAAKDHVQHAEGADGQSESGGEDETAHCDQGNNIQQPLFLSIGLIGQPNVGKSSLLNALLGKHVVRASRTPGKTKSLQTIYWTPEVRLVDCPGLVFPSLVGMENQVLSGVIPIQNVEAVIYEIGQKMPLEEILQVQKLEDAQGEEWSTDSLLSSLAVQRGFLTAKAARPDLYRAGSLVIRGIQASLIPWSFRPATYDDDAVEVRQHGIYLLPSSQHTVDELSASKQRLDALHAMPEEEEKGGADTAEISTEDEQFSDESASDDEDGEALSSASEGERDEDAQPASPRGRSSASGGAFSLLSIDDGEDEQEEEEERPEQEGEEAYPHSQ